MSTFPLVLWYRLSLSESTTLPPSSWPDSSFSPNVGKHIQNSLSLKFCYCPRLLCPTLYSPQLDLCPNPHLRFFLCPFRINKAFTWPVPGHRAHPHTLSYLLANCEVSRAGIIKSTLQEATGAQGGHFPGPSARVQPSEDFVQAYSLQVPRFSNYSLKPVESH